MVVIIEIVVVVSSFESNTASILNLFSSLGNLLSDLWCGRWWRIELTIQERTPRCFLINATAWTEKASDWRQFSPIVNFRLFCVIKIEGWHRVVGAVRFDYNYMYLYAWSTMYIIIIFKSTLTPSKMLGSILPRQALWTCSTPSWCEKPNILGGLMYIKIKCSEDSKSYLSTGSVARLL